MKTAAQTIEDAVDALSFGDKHMPVAQMLPYLQGFLKRHDEEVEKMKENLLTAEDQWMMAEIMWRPIASGEPTVRLNIVNKMAYQMEASDVSSTQR